MPRPKSELTGPHYIAPDMSARLTEAQHIMFLRLGGSTWLRKKLDAELQHMAARPANPIRRSGI